jgi:hypothetical protein
MKTLGYWFAGIAGSVALLSIHGCASADASNKKSLLSAAGFRIKAPETPKQKELYAAAPAYQVQKFEINGRQYYAYKDEKAGVAYVGGEPEYQRYHELAVQQKIAKEQYTVAPMERQTGFSWFRAWGSPVMW